MAKQAAVTGNNGRLTHGQFAIKAIKALRKDGYEGIHVVYSGFNQAFREYFPDADVREATATLSAQGIIRMTPCKGGAMMFDGSVPYTNTREAKTNETLSRILG